MTTAPTAPPAPTAPSKVSASALRAEIASNRDLRLLDVRTPGEFQSGHIAGSVNVPLDQVIPNARKIAAQASGRVVVICQAGQRATQAADKLSAAGVPDLAVLDDGMNAWLAAGAPIEDSADSAKKRWALERQVRLVAGGIVASSVLASIWKPKARFLAGGVGAGLVFAAVSNTCMMGSALMKLPYNKGAEADVDEAISCLSG
jgi:rhodanese-related sulfurtransferase